jgi:hypothetical protein
MMREEKLEIGVRPAILRSCLPLSGGKISSASICIHRPQDQVQVIPRSSEHRVIENRKNLRPDPGLVYITATSKAPSGFEFVISVENGRVRRLNSCPAARYATNL